MLTMKYLFRGIITSKPCSDVIIRPRPIFSKPKREEEDEGFIKRDEFNV